MLLQAEGERAVGHEKSFHQFPLQGRGLQRSAHQSLDGEGINGGAGHAALIALGRPVGDGAQQGLMGLRKGLLIRAGDVQEGRMERANPCWDAKAQPC
jgi:hypothetical protein